MGDPKVKLRIYLTVLVVIMTVGTAGFIMLENLSVADAFYFSIVTVATVGYGDIHPSTPIGKLLAIILIIGGVGTFLGVVASATDMLMNRRENRLRMQKLNMVLGLFFGEMGTRLLESFSGFDTTLEQAREHLLITAKWAERDFARAKKRIQSNGFVIDIHQGNLEDLNRFLNQEQQFLLRLLENPVLLEHEALADLLRAIVHLREEFMNRPALDSLPATDYAHLSKDIKRAYGLLIPLWLDYMSHVKTSYPYLFHLALRRNPFDPDASVIVKS